MKFLSGSRFRSGHFVVRPGRTIRDLTSGHSQDIPALRAHFKEHRFDSEVAQRAFGWTDEERQQVEKHLMDSQQWGRGDGRGVFLDNSATLTDKEIRARGANRRCLFMQDMGEDGTVQCHNQVENTELDYCDMHQAVLEASGAQGV